MISPKAEAFLDNLHAYLVSYGKKEEEIKSVVAELRDHFVEAEKRGKSFEDITGPSTKVYMDQIRKEMKTDKSESLSILLLFFPLAISFIILPEAIRGEVSYSLLQMTGYLITSVLVLAMFIFFLRFDASRKLSAKMRLLMFWLIGVVPMAMFLIILVLNQYLKLEPYFIATPTQNIIIAIICTLFLIGYSLFCKTWITIIVPLLFIAPDWIAKQLASTPENQAIINISLTFAGIALFLLVVFLHSKRQSSAR